MTEVPLPFNEREELGAVASVSDGVLELKLSGTADLRVSNDLPQLLGAVHDAALEHGSQRVTVDLMQLEFMNSSCIKAFVTWLARMQREPEQRQYRVVFVSNPEILWQKGSLRAFQCLAPDHVAVELRAP